MSRNSIAASAFLLTAGTATAQFVFDPGVDYGVGVQPDGIAAADFDGDTDLDLAVVTDGPAGGLEVIEILLNNGDGTYVAGPIVFLPNSSSPTELIAADLDGDMDQDLAVILRDLQQVQVVINTGGADFSLGSTVGVGDRARGMTAGDYDGDTDTDLVVANRDDNTATVLTNGGTASFTATTLAAGNEPRAAAFIDIDGNADIDVAVTNHDDRTVSLFTNTGSGFTPSGTLSTGAQLRPEGIVAAELNGDGLEDLAVAANDDVQPDAAIVYLNQGGSFGAGAFYLTSGQNTSGILAADLDCDMTTDLVTRNEDSNDLSLLQNLGGGVFGAPSMLSTGLAPSQMTAADLDGDGDEDLAVSNRDSNDVSVYINQTCTPGPICAGSGTLIEGAGEINDFNATCGSDNSYWAAHGEVFAFQVSDPVSQFELIATAPAGFGGNSISVDVEASKENDSANLNIRVEMFNFTTASYVALPGVMALTTADQIQTFELPAGSDPNDFVEPGTDNVQLLIQTIQTSGLPNTRTQLDEVLFIFD